MDNNKRVELNKIEYESMYTVSKINKVNTGHGEVNTNIQYKFDEAMRKAQKSLKKKKSVVKSNLNDDIVVESSLKKLIDEDKEISKTVEEKVSSSKVIKELLSDKEITPSEEKSIIKKTGI